MGTEISKLIGKTLLWPLAALVLIGMYAWSIGAIYYSNLPWAAARAAIAFAFGVGVLAALVFVKNRRRTLVIFLAAFACVLIWWLTISPKSEGEYPPETAVLTRVDFQGSLAQVRNVRNFDYQSETEFKVRHEDRNYDLDRVRSVDFIVSYWDDLDQIAHTMLSFGFDNGEQLAVSVEIRRENKEIYSVLKGIFKQFELIYVWADERDLIGLRTNHRGEDVYLYPTTCGPTEARLLLKDMLEATERFAVDPVFYNTVTQNCTSTIVGHVNAVLPVKVPLLKRRLRNGYSDQRAHEQGWIAGEGSFAEIKKAALINERALGAEDQPDFSQRIRTHFNQKARTKR